MNNCIVLPNEILLGEASQLLREGKDVVMSIKGSSMLPFLKEGRDSVRLKKKDKAEVGDIVLAEITPGKYIIHRVYALDSDSITLMGDGNIRGTEKCLQKDIRGTVIQILDRKGQTRKVTKGRLWKALKPFRRIILGIYRRIAL